MDAKLNAADSTSKLMFENVESMNFKLYRKGPGNLNYDSEDWVVFYRSNKNEEEWIPLPENLIMRAKAETSETCAKNKPEEVEECEICHQMEDCGIYLTRLMAREQEEAGKEVEILSGLKAKKRKLLAEAQDWFVKPAGCRHSCETETYYR
jgi:hypothetical protein